MAADPPARRDVGISGEDRRIRELRPGRPEVDPWRPLGVESECERLPGGEVATSVTLFLAGAQCPFTCVFCDLWRYTIDGATPLGALPRQIDVALERASLGAEVSQVKLYNASNFFDERAVPRRDWEPIAERLRPFQRVVVECHPRLVGPRCSEFADLLDGDLEVAMGLETAHPGALRRLNKKMTIEDFNRAARWLRDAGIRVRAFVLVGVPWVPEDERRQWVLASARHAFEHGAELVSLIPLRDGNGALDQLGREGRFVRPTLEDLEVALEQVIGLDSGAVQVDTWDLDPLVDCVRCGADRIERIQRMNARGKIEPAVVCEVCSSGCGPEHGSGLT